MFQSNLHRFTARPCCECPEPVLVAAIADWLMSPERFRFGETEKRDRRPGRCILCGAATRDAFVIVSEGETKGITPGSPKLPMFLSAWHDSDSPKLADATGRTWALFPVFVCEAASGTKPDLFSMAEVEVRRRKREFAKKAEEAERASGATPAPRTRTAI